MKNSFRILKQDYLFILIIIIFIMFFLYRSYVFEDTYFSIGKVYDTTIKKGSGSYVEYVYYANNKIKTGVGKVEIGEANKFIGNFYQIEVSNENSSWSRINLNKKITDHKEINIFLKLINNEEK